MSQNESSLQPTAKPWQQRIDWPVTLYLLLTPLVAMILVPIYFVVEDVHWPLALFTILFAAATNLSITAGYHRLFSHRSYEAHPLIRAIYPAVKQVTVVVRRAGTTGTLARVVSTAGLDF